MAYSVDANVLIYASDTSHKHHARAVEFVRECASSRETFYLSWPTVLTYLRITTHPTIFTNPLAPSEAARNIDALVALPHVRLLSEDDEFWPTFKDIGAGHVLRGNLVPEAHLAALLRANDVSVIYSADADLRRFKFLDVRNPFTDG